MEKEPLEPTGEDDSGLKDKQWQEIESFQGDRARIFGVCAAETRQIEGLEAGDSPR